MGRGERNAEPHAKNAPCSLLLASRASCRPEERAREAGARRRTSQASTQGVVAADYGSSDDPALFEALLAYSPYHNLKPGTKYPATLVTTGDTDDRVVPGHSFKYAAALQAAQAGIAPVLIRIETRAGHGAGKPLSKRIEETADLWSFLYANLGMKLPREFGK